MYCYSPVSAVDAAITVRKYFNNIGSFLLAGDGITRLSPKLMVKVEPSK